MSMICRCTQVHAYIPTCVGTGTPACMHPDEDEDLDAQEEAIDNGKPPRGPGSGAFAHARCPVLAIVLRMEGDANLLRLQGARQLLQVPRVHFKIYPRGSPGRDFRISPPRSSLPSVIT